MTQQILSRRASIPQSTVARIEKGDKDIKISTLNKILKALFCDLLILPVLNETIDSIRKKQAQKKAKQSIDYLKGTMNLEKQHVDDNFVNDLLEKEEARFLYEKKSKLWDK